MTDFVVIHGLAKTDIVSRGMTESMTFWKGGGPKMNGLKKIVPVFFLLLCLFSPYAGAESEEDVFDFMLAVTRQDIEMNWWFSVPPQFGPVVTSINEVTKGENFKILPIFSNYGSESGKEVDISYDVEIVRPDGTIDVSEKSLTGFKGRPSGDHLLPSQGILVVSFDPEDPFGEYTINVSARDHIKNRNVKKSRKITLRKFGEIETEESPEKWFRSYPMQPRPSSALATFVNSPRPFLDEKGHALWSGLWIYKIVYSENEFLIPHTVEFYINKATGKQRKDIILLFHLLGKTGLLPIGKEYKDYLSDVLRIEIPDPYEKIETGDQLDMLWAEFFATSRIKPIRQILTAFNLSAHIGTLDKIKTGELKKTDDVLKKAMLEAVFQSAVWSTMSNCKQSPLVFHYCAGLFESGQLNETEKGYLGAILKNVSQEKQKPAE